MILNIIVFFNKRIECFTTPNFDDHSPKDAAVQLERSLKLNLDKEDIIRSYKFLDMYHFGTFEDSTGKIDLLEKPVKLLDCSKLLGVTEEEINEGKVEDVD